VNRQPSETQGFYGAYKKAPSNYGLMWIERKLEGTRGDSEES
jgi:hypothetical protein